jgi:molybdate transport system substrate-binding protein
VLPRLSVALLLAVSAIASGACGGATPDTTAPDTTAPDTVGSPSVGAAVTGTVTVLAAASLTESFTELGKAFEAAYPRARVRFSFAASSALAAQVNRGAPADVFASADTTNMDKVTGSSGAGTLAVPEPFATNTLQIIAGKGNPKDIAGLADLAKPGITYVAAAPVVPIGAYAQQALAKAQVAVAPKSLETDVKAVVTKVTLGEADAGIVFATDVKAARDKAQGIAIPDAHNVVATYPIAVLNGAKNSAGAQAFVRFVTSDDGQAILSTYGFSPP